MIVYELLSLTNPCCLNGSDVVSVCCQDEDKDDVEKHLDMPPSWVEPLSLSLKEYQTRCPQGKKSVLYQRAKLEKFAHYLNKDGLITKLSIYHDKDCKQKFLNFLLLFEMILFMIISVKLSGYI